MPLTNGVYRIVNYRTQDSAALPDGDEDSYVLTIIPGLHSPKEGFDPGDKVDRIPL